MHVLFVYQIIVDAKIMRILSASRFSPHCSEIKAICSMEMAQVKPKRKHT